MRAPSASCCVATGAAPFTWRPTPSPIQRRRRTDRATVPLDEDQEVEAASGGWETRLQVDALLARLGDELRVTLVLREVGGLSYEEIARELKIPVGTVRSRLSAAREQFRRL